MLEAVCASWEKRVDAPTTLTSQTLLGVLVMLPAEG